MHILVVNDDGPPSNQSSPYVHSLVKSLQGAGHTVSVCLPHTQRSWIGKAHLVGHTVTPTYFRPGTLHEDDGTIHSRPLPPGSKQQEEWILVDGTPASCVQIGIYHYFKDRGPIDLVISGPNYGRNSTAVFGLNSGTVGGALEAAVCRKKAIAISYAFESRNHDPVIIAGASRQSLRLVEYLYKNWGHNVDLYSINVPLIENVEKRKVLQTNILQNYWGPSSCFEEIEDDMGDADEEEQKIREREDVEENGIPISISTRHKHKHFKWAPKFVDVHKSVEASAPGNDGWAVKHGFTSVTPLKANFMHAEPGMEGELKLLSVPEEIKSLPTSAKPSQHFYALVDYEDAYVQPLIISALTSRLPLGSYTIILSTSSTPSSCKRVLHIRSYEKVPFDDVMAHPGTCFANAYVIRKALIRKHYLSKTAHNWITKRPLSILSTNIKPTCDFELDYAEFLDDALVEAWELQASFQKNEDKGPAEREWWILKPGMSDRGQGIQLFSTEAELQSIFETWESDRPDSEDGEGDEGEGEGTNASREGNEQSSRDYIMASQLRHFVAQPYIHPPLLLPNNPHKFHIRTYVVAVGSLKVYVYRPMLALFASTPYTAPWSPSTTSSPSQPDLSAHLTNTCLQDGTREGAVQAFWSLPSTASSRGPCLPAAAAPSSDPPIPSWQQHVFAQICSVTGEIFEAAARGMVVHFQTMPNAFEVFGLDFLVDAGGTAWLLEVNAFPDFKQTGSELQDLIGGLWKGVVDVAVAPFFGVDVIREDGQGENMVLVRDLDLGRR